MALDTALRHARCTVPHCLAAGVVDIDRGLLLAAKTLDDQSPEILAELAAATAEIFQGENAVAIERASRRIRGDTEDGEPPFREIVVFAGNLLRIFLRCTHNSNIVLVCICRGQANLGMALVRARSCLSALDDAI